MSEERTPPPLEPDAPSPAPEEGGEAPLEPAVAEPDEDDGRAPDQGPGGDPA